MITGSFASAVLDFAYSAKWTHELDLGTDWSDPYALRPESNCCSWPLFDNPPFAHVLSNICPACPSKYARLLLEAR